jgi:uncharacterized membrane protein
MTSDTATQSAAVSDDGTPGNDRIISLSDGVFAFAMTLMVLTLDTPARDKVGPAQLREAILEQWPGLLAYALTFFVIANYWVVHHRLFQFLRGHDAGLIWLNICFLFLISFLPFPTDVMGDYYDVPFAITFYAISMALVSGVSMLIWLYVVRRPQLCTEAVTPRLARYNLLRGVAVTSVFLLSAGIAQVSIEVARYLWLILFPLFRLLAHHYRDALPGSPTPEPSGV